MYEYDSLAVALKKWRSTHSMSLVEASEVSGLPQSTISNYEKKKYMPTGKNIKLLAKILDVGSADILEMAEYDKEVRNRVKQKDQ